MTSLIHTRLNEVGVINYATLIYNHHNPVVQSISLEQALQELHNGTRIDEPDFRPAHNETLTQYIESIVNLSNGILTLEQLREYSTIVYNHLINTEREFVGVEDLVEEVTEAGQIDHPF